MTEILVCVNRIITEIFDSGVADGSRTAKQFVNDLQLIATAKLLGFLAAARAAQIVADLLERLIDRKGTARTRKRGLLGIPRCKRRGSPARSFLTKLSHCLRKPRFRPSRDGLGFHAGTRAGFAKATALIHGTGRRWRNLGIEQ